jgi:hypothetical protein
MHLAASHRRLSLLVVALLLCVVGLVRSLSAQTTNAKIIGVVTDPSGAVVPGAKVTVRNTLTNVSTTVLTNKSGGYEALSLPIGQYSVEVEKSGFATTTSPAYALQINQTQKVDFKLPLAGATQAIEVTIQAAAIDTVSSTIGGSVTERPLVDLPLNGRDILDLAQLQPGVTLGNPDNGSATGVSNAGGISVAGGRTDSITYLLDGGNNTSLLNNGVVFSPNPDSVEEFRILENNYSAEYGRNGGGVISVVSKSGTRAYHGTAFDFDRNDAFNANDFFNKRNGVARDPLKRHQFGGTFGGEIFVPKFLPRKDKFFYFFSYEGQRLIDTQNNGVSQIATTAEVVNGDFSGAGALTQSLVAQFLQANPYFQSDPVKASEGIFDPTTFDPVAQAYIKAGIFPYNATGFVNSIAKYTDNFDQYNGKFDFAFSDKDHFAVSLATNNHPSTSPFAGGATTPFPVSNLTKAYIINIDETHAFTAKLLNDARFVAQRLKTVQDVPLEQLPGPQALGIGVTPDQTTGPTILSFDDTGTTFGFSYQGPTTLNNNTFAYTDDLTWVHGHHNLKFGAYYAAYQNNTLYDFVVDGDFSFFGLSDANDNIGPGTGYAEFLAGIPDNYEQYGSALSNIRSKATAFYAQDEWHITPQLTLNLGLRYEYSIPKFDTAGRSFSLIPGAQSTRFTGAPEGLLFPGDPGAPKGANFPVKDNFAPRFGFAYDVGGKGKTVIRGGTGVFFDILKGEDNLQFNGQAPFYGYENLYPAQPSGATAPLGIYENPFAATGTVNTFPSKPPTQNLDFDASGFLPFGGGGVYFVDPHLRTPYTIQFNLGVERDLGLGITAEVAYVGSVSRKYTSLADSNPYVIGTQTRLYNQINGNELGSEGDPSFGDLDTFRNVTSENYNSLQASLRKGTSHIQKVGTTYFQLSYTFAKNMDNVSGFRQRNSEVPYYNPGLFYAPSDLNSPQRIVLSGGWDLPFDDFFPGAPKALTKGWSLYPIASKQTGFPLDVLANFQRDNSNGPGGLPGPTGAGDQELIRANLVGTKVTRLNPYTTTTSDGGALYFNPGNFSDSNIVGYGTLRRNSFYGPGFSNIDMSVAKATNLTRGEHPLNLELKADLFNMFNFAEFANPNTTISSSQFGEITTTRDESYRIIQLAGKLRF